MGRTQFTFYESFYRSVARIKKAADRAKAYDIICAYALYGDAPNLDSLPDSAAIAFEVAKPILDAAWKKSEGGKRGGKSKHSESMVEASDKQTEKLRKQDKEQDKEKEKVQVQEQMLLTPCSPPSTTTTDPNVSVVISDYLNRINPAASKSSLEELASFAQEMGKEVCIRAFDVALDSKKATWPYIRAILRSKREQGVTCLADWEAAEQKRPGGKPQSEPVGTVTADDVDFLFSLARNGGV